MSQKATRMLLEGGWQRVWNVRGGLVQWREEVDGQFPMY
jgi:predicted sulfurtransferase